MKHGKLELRLGFDPRVSGTQSNRSGSDSPRSRARSAFWALCRAGLIAGPLLLPFVPSTSHAIIHFPRGRAASDRVVNGCLDKFPPFPTEDTVEFCAKMGALADPVVTGIDTIQYTLTYNIDKLIFDPSRSGPLGILSVGGDSPPVDPGVGTQPFTLWTPTGYRPGAPLPGSTLTYEDVGGVLTITYKLADPISIDDPLNFFLTAFKRKKPIWIDADLTKSLNVYYSDGPGNLFSDMGLSCSPIDCGSDNPVSGVSEFPALVAVPEPGTWALLIVGFGGLGAALRKRRMGQVRARPA